MLISRVKTILFDEFSQILVDRKTDNLKYILPMVFEIAITATVC